MASMSTLQDNFTIDDSATLWSGSFGTFSISGGQLSLSDGNFSAGYAGLQSTSHFDLTNSFLAIKLVNAGAQTASTQALIQCQKDANNTLSLMVNNSQLLAQTDVAGSFSTVGSPVTYNATNHRWLRISESAGIVNFGYSADGITWNTLATVANPFAVTSLLALVLEGNFAGDAAATTSTWDNLNILPVTGTGSSRAKKLIATGTGSDLPARGKSHVTGLEPYDSEVSGKSATSTMSGHT